MAAGHAERVSRETGKRVVILDKGGKPRWHEVWEGNPAIVRQPEADTVSIRNASGCRPYIRYPWVERCRFTDWRAPDPVRPLHLTGGEGAVAARIESPCEEGM